MIHLAAFQLTADQAGVIDQVLNVTGNNIRVPEQLPFILGASTFISAQPSAIEAQLQAPSLRDMWYPDLFSANEVAFDGFSLQTVDWFDQNAFSLVPSENLNYFTAVTAGAVVDIYGLVWFSDGAPAEVTGDIKTVRCTSTIDEVKTSWVNGELSFDQVLPYGDYQVVGMRVQGETPVAARLVFPGGTWRPGAIASFNQAQAGMPQMRMGKAGAMGVFNTNVPPSVDVLGDTGSDQTYWLDLIKVG